MKGKKLIPKEKFLKTQHRLFNTMAIYLNEDYPHLAKIKLMEENSRMDIDNQLNIVNTILASFKKYEQNKAELSKDVLFYLGAYAFSLTLTFFMTNMFFHFNLPFHYFLTIYVMGNCYSLFKEHPYLKTLIKAKVKGENVPTLKAYYNTLQELDNLAIKYQQEINQKEKQIAAEQNNLNNSLIEDRNTALWQIEAFRDNNKYLKKALNANDYLYLTNQIQYLYSLLSLMRKKEEKAQKETALLIDETLNEIYNLYDRCEKDNNGKKLVKRL